MNMIAESEIPFEELMKRLEKTVSELEGGTLSLENSMKAYEEGVFLVRKAQERLFSLEGRMEQLLSSGEIVPLIVPEQGI